MKKQLLQFALFLLTLISYPTSSQAQTGNLFLNNYKVSIANFSNNNLALCQGKDGKIYFANTKGILVYDGALWNIIPTSATPYILAADTSESGKLYVGSKNDFGFLETNESGINKYVSLSKDQKNIGAITQIALTTDKAYFMSRLNLFEITIKDGKISQTFPLKSGTYTGLFVQNKKVYINISGKGLTMLEGNIFKTVAGTDILSGININSIINFPKNKVLLTTNQNKLFVFDGKTLTPYTIQSQNYIDLNLLAGGTSLSEKTFALSTVSGGCLVIDKMSGKTNNIVNFQTGLPDDEILALGSDKQDGLWICHQMGISRADTRLPLQNYSSYPGLVGNVTQVLYDNSTLHVATTEGVFYLDKVDSYDEVSNFVKPKKQIQQRTKTIKIVESQKGLNLGILNGLFGSKKKRTVVTSEQINLVNAEPADIKADSQKEIYALQSIPFIFKRIENFTGKAKQLTAINGQIIVSGSNGLFLIAGNTSQNILPNIYVNFVYPSTQNGNRIYIGTNEGLFSGINKGGSWSIENYTGKIKTPVNYICQDSKNLWVGGENQVLKASLSSNGSLQQVKSYNVENQYAESIPIFIVAGKPAFFLSSGIYNYNEQSDKLEKNNILSEENKATITPVYGQGNLNYTIQNYRWKELSNATDNSKPLAFLNLFNQIKHVYVDTQKNIWITNDENNIYKIDGLKADQPEKSLSIFLNSVTDKQGNAVPLDDITVGYDNNALNFGVSTREYGAETGSQYQFKVKGIGNEWSNWSPKSLIEFPVLPGGSYTLSVKARNVYGVIGEQSDYPFFIRPPFWKSWWFQLIIFLALSAGVYSFIKYRTHRLEEANRILEAKVKERTAEVVKQKDQIEIQKNDIEIQKKDLEVAYTDISKKNKHITSSINYAQKIQHAILPLHLQMQKSLNELFVFFKPRDIVSGDFYWFSEKGNWTIIAAVDCTGHGVPGAFMSMIGNTLLNQIVNEKNIIQPDLILNELNLEVRKSLKQNDDNSERQDGMDIAICAYNKQLSELHYAGANNPLYLIKNNELEEIKANKFSIGGRQKEEKSFTSHIIKVTDPTSCYLFSDGFADQFGGPYNKKFMSKNFKQLLLDIHSKSAEDQYNELDQTIANWKGNEAQIDDILILGFKIYPL